MGLVSDKGDSRGVMLITVMSVFWVFAVIAVGLRIWARHITRASYVLNDYAIFIAIVLATALVGIVIAAVPEGGLGKHLGQGPPDGLIFLAKMTIVGQVIWAVANVGIKVSILDLFNRIFVTKWFVRVSYVLMGLGICVGVVICLEAFFICRPLAFNWDKSIDGVCGDQDKAYRAQAIVNLFVDVAIVLLPVPMLWKLQMPLAKKLGVYVMFSIGICICVLTGLRIHAIEKLVPSDITFTQVHFALFNVLETLLGILNTCLPVIRPVLKKIPIRKSFPWTKNTKETGSSDARSYQKTWYRRNKVPSSYRSKLGDPEFQQIDEHRYPLNEITSVDGHNTVKVGRADTSTDDIEGLVGFTSDDAVNKIRVTQDWQVISR